MFTLCTFGTRHCGILQSSIGLQSLSFRTPESVTPSAASLPFPASVIQTQYILQYYTTIKRILQEEIDKKRTISSFSALCTTQACRCHAKSKLSHHVREVKYCVFVAMRNKIRLHLLPQGRFHREAISSTAGGFIPPTADFAKKDQLTSELVFFLAGALGFEPR